MEIQPSHTQKQPPIKPVLKIVPHEMTILGSSWTYDGQKPEDPGEIAVYKRGGKSYHITVVVRTGATHCSPQGGPLEGLSLHVYADTPDDYRFDFVPSHLRQLARQWFQNHRVEMRQVCASVSGSWRDLKKSLRADYKARRQEYYVLREEYSIWLETLSGSAISSEREARERSEHQERVQLNKVLELASKGQLPKVEKCEDGRLKVGPIDGKRIFYLATPEVLQPATSKIGWTPEAYEAATAGQFIMAVSTGSSRKLYICSRSALLECERVDLRVIWKNNLPIAEYDDSGFLRSHLGNFRLPPSRFADLREAAKSVPTGKGNCVRVVLNGREVVVWLDNPKLKLASENDWHAWCANMGEVTSKGSKVSIPTGSVSETYMVPQTFPDEPPVGTPDCWRITHGNSIFIARIRNNPAFRKVAPGSRNRGPGGGATTGRAGWIRSLPEAKLETTKYHRYLHVGGVIYRVARGEFDKIAAASNDVAVGAEGAFTVRIGGKLHAVCPGGESPLVETVEDWNLRVSGLPKAVLNSIGKLEVAYPKSSKIFTYEVKRPGKYPPKDVPADWPAVCVLDVEDGSITICPASPGSAEYFSSPGYEARTEWIKSLPQAVEGTVEGVRVIFLNKIPYMPPRRDAMALLGDSIFITRGTNNCYQLRGEGGTIGPIWGDDPDDPLVAFAEWKKWAASLPVAKAIGDRYIFTGGGSVEIFTVDFGKLNEPPTGKPGCRVVVDPGTNRYQIVDPDDESYVKKSPVSGHDEYELVEDIGHDYCLVRVPRDTTSTWESVFCAKKSRVPVDPMTLLMKREQPGTWSGFFLQDVSMLDFQTWLDGLPINDGFLTYNDLGEPFLDTTGPDEVMGPDRPITLDASDPVPIYRGGSAGWFRVQKSPDMWAPAQYIE